MSIAMGGILLLIETMGMANSARRVVYRAYLMARPTNVAERLVLLLPLAK